MDKARHNQIAYPVEIYRPYVPSLKWPEIHKVAYWYTGVSDDGLEVDTLLLLFVNNTCGTSIDADADCDMLIRFDGETGEVHGLEIEDFEDHFLKKHPELADGWAALKPEGKKGFHNTPWLSDELALGYARRLRDMAYQGTVTPGWPFEDLESIADRDGSFRRRLPQLSRRDGDGGGGAG